MTFLDLIKKNGFTSISEYLNSMNSRSDSPEFTARELRAIKKAEAATAAFLEA